MKINAVCKRIFILICLFYGFELNAQEVKLTLNVTPGNLESLLGSQQSVVTDLTLTGSINASDVGGIRRSPLLSKLNLANVNLVAGGSFYVNQVITVTDNHIPDYMFFNLGNLISVVLPNSVISIGDQAFQECTALTSVTIGSKVTSIGFFAFGNCSELTSITLPESLQTISNQAFWSCQKLSSITIPASVTSIGNGVFAICSALKSITVADANSVYSSVSGVLFSKDKLMLITYPNSKSTIYTIPDNVTSIGEYAFETCSGLASVVIGNNVTTIGEGAFYSCTGLTSVVIGSKVTSIGKNVFYNCSALNSVVIPNSVTYIGWDAFGYCTAMLSLSLGTGITTIDIYAFDSCIGLKSITIPSGVTSIGDWALSYCTSLTEVHSKPKAPPTAASSTFYGIDNYNCKLYVPIGSSAAYRGATGWNVFRTFIEEPGTAIPLIGESPLKVYTENDAVVINGTAYGDEILVYNMLGELLYHSKAQSNVSRIELPLHNIYVVKVLGKTFKIVLL
ncbi:leucine-rich repeat protein [uncultured Bacteroides sp.]|uniref:leucine-rich repeat domain-containing protein n=1 Tax=uncultured Bacteroides sp. TaxID=162156 RepID=UPI002AAB2DD7|nr:leucine-rich repeat protein [uncultured Bacteroides sp.]